jgi:hypothetical protein
MKTAWIAIAMCAAACGGKPGGGGGGGGGGGTTIGNTSDTPGAAPHEVMATLERTACYGTCPIYKLAVYRDGTVEYDGEGFVKVHGKATGQITLDDVARLDAMFAEAHYFDLKDAYTEYRMTDMPSANTSYAKDGKQKAIAHYHGDDSAPEALSKLEDGIDQVVHVEQFIGTEKERENIPYK